MNELDEMNELVEVQRMQAAAEAETAARRLAAHKPNDLGNYARKVRSGPPSEPQVAPSKPVTSGRHSSRRTILQSTAIAASMLAMIGAGSKEYRP